MPSVSHVIRLMQNGASFISSLRTCLFFFQTLLLTKMIASVSVVFRVSVLSWIYCHLDHPFFFVP